MTHAEIETPKPKPFLARDRYKEIEAVPPLEDSGSRKHQLLEHLETDPLWTLNNARQEPLVDPEILSNLIFVRNLNRHYLDVMDSQARFEVKPWTRTDKDESGAPLPGGGVMSLLRGADIEKSAVNMSLLRGAKYPSIESEYAGKPFTACGVSLISHPYNPLAPIAHMNVRALKVGSGDNAVTWIGGGGDLTPMVEFPEDTNFFHQSFKEVCEAHPLGDYPKFKSWCDEYFYIPHRGSARGVGGIFFDYIPIEKPSDSWFLVLVGAAFARSYAKILSRRLDLPFTEEQKEKHLYWRGRYAEFNLVYDRGTRFGLMSGGNIEAIFGSLPPVVKW